MRLEMPSMTLQSLATETPIFSRESEQALAMASTRPAICAILTAVAQRCADVDEEAAGRASSLLSSLAVQSDAHAVFERTIEEILQAAGSITNSASWSCSSGAQRSALTLVLARCIGKGGQLRQHIASACNSHIVRGGADYETLCPVIICGGPVSLHELIHVCKPLLATAEHVLTSCGEQKQRLRAVACCREVWQCALGRWPEQLDAHLQPSSEARLFAAVVVNTVVNTVLLDPVGKVRLTAMRMVQQIAQSHILDRKEMYNLAIMKARDKDKETRCTAMGTLMLLEGNDEQHGSPNKGDSLLAQQLNAMEVNQLIVHGMAGPHSTASTRTLAQRAFQSYLHKHRGQPAKVLADLQALEQRGVYEELFGTLDDSLMAEVYAAAFPETQQATEDEEMQKDDVGDEMDFEGAF